MPAERNFISVKNQLSPKNLKPKKINDCTEIINRVERAGCCLLPNEPETKLVLSNAVGDGSDYLWNPNSKAHKIRHKFFQQNFLQSVTEDFMLVQNLDRIVDSTIITSDEFFKVYEISDLSEQQLLVRLFKRFFHKSITKKYGYLKSKCTDFAEISSKIFCEELEMNPKLLTFFGVITAFDIDTKLQWQQFVKILAIFLLRKNVRTFRIQVLE